MSVINPDEWHPVAGIAARSLWAADCHDTDIRAAAAVLCLLDLARYGIRWGDPEPEWVRCVSTHGAHYLTRGKVYPVVATRPGWVAVRNDRGDRFLYSTESFVPASADEATVTIDVPVAWARARATLGQPERALSLAVDTTCREALSKAGLL